MTSVAQTDARTSATTTGHTTAHTTTGDNDSARERSHLWSLIKDIRFGMFTASQANGELHARPMTTQNQAIDEDASLWFFMSRRSGPVADLAAAPEVNVAYADTDADRYVSVAGHAAVVDDPARTRRLWSAMNEAWFPGGPDDPDLALVQVRIHHAGYWDVKASKLVQIFRMARAAISGKPPTDMGEHGELRLDR